MKNGISHHYQLDEFTFILRGVRSDVNFFISFFDETSLCKQKSPRWDAALEAASHLGLFCLPMSHKRDTRLKLTNRHATVDILIW